MKSINVDILRSLFDYDSKTGKLHWKNKGVGHKAGDEVSSISNGKLRVGIAYQYYLVHRVIWAMAHGQFPVNVIDHIDGNPLNNKLENLRDVDVKTNNENRRKPAKHNATGFLGVQIDRGGMFCAVITSSSKKKYLGRFSTPEEAHQVFLNAKRQLHKGCSI